MHVDQNASEAPSRSTSNGDSCASSSLVRSSTSTSGRCTPNQVTQTRLERLTQADLEENGLPLSTLGNHREKIIELQPPDSRKIVMRRFPNLSPSMQRLHASREVLAYALSEYLSFGIVPPMVRFQADTRVVLYEFIPTEPGEPSLFSTLMPPIENSNRRIFDYLLNVPRRGEHASRLIRNVNDDSVYSIHHDGILTPLSDQSPVAEPPSDEEVNVFFRDPTRESIFREEAWAEFFDDSVPIPARDPEGNGTRGPDAAEYTKVLLARAAMKALFLARTNALLQRLKALQQRHNSALPLHDSRFPLATPFHYPTNVPSLPDAYSRIPTITNRLARLPNDQLVVHRNFGVPANRNARALPLQVQHAAVNHELLAFRIHQQLCLNILPQTTALHNRPGQLITAFYDFQEAPRFDAAQSAIPIFEFLLQTTRPNDEGYDVVADASGETFYSINHASIFRPESLLSAGQILMLDNRKEAISNRQLAAFFASPRTTQVFFETDWDAQFDEFTSTLPDYGLFAAGIKTAFLKRIQHVQNLERIRQNRLPRRTIGPSNPALRFSRNDIQGPALDNTVDTTAPTPTAYRNTQPVQLRTLTEQRILQRTYAQAYSSSIPIQQRAMGNEVFASLLDTQLQLGIVPETMQLEGTGNHIVSIDVNGRTPEQPDLRFSPIPVLEYLLGTAPSTSEDPSAIVSDQNNRLYRVNNAQIFMPDAIVQPDTLTDAQIRAFFHSAFTVDQFENNDLGAFFDRNTVHLPSEEATIARSAFLHRAYLLAIRRRQLIQNDATRAAFEKSMKRLC